jgi:DNA-3-methyladenine glycosylase I
VERTRCSWCSEKNPLYVHYHDEEWGVPCHTDGKLFELLVLECFQAGLSWETILNKRENFRAAFDHFDPERIQNYDETKIQKLLQDSGIIRNRRKIEAAIINARIFLSIQDEWGTFDHYIWHFTNGQTLHELGLSHSALSDEISADMRRRGMKFIGSTVVYAYLQAIGVIESHEETCFLHGDKALREKQQKRL